MSINAIRLRSFRGFKDVTLPLKPLTVLLGPNSSGKSSFGHAFAATTHCQRREAGGQRPSLTPSGDPDEWPIDLGTVNDLRTHGKTGRIHIGFEIDNQWIDFGFGETQFRPNNLTLSYLSHPFNPVLPEVVEPEGKSLEAAGPESRSEAIRVPLREIPETAAQIGLRRESESIWWDESANQQATVDLDGLLVSSMKHTGGTPFAPQRQTLDALRSFFATTTYLRASRKRPARNYVDDVGPYQAIGYAGEWTATLLREKGSDRVSFPDPPDLPNNTTEARSALERSWATWSGGLVEGVARWLKTLGLASGVESIQNPDDKRRVQVRVMLPGQQPRNITEVGFGISQVLPVLTAGLMQPKGGLFIVDLPEAHLHPLPQARIADFFCSLALSGRNALVETHSEVFFHWLRLRAELSDELRDKIAVYFISRPSEDGCCSPPQSVGLTGRAQLQWPVGFFEEAWDIETRIKTVREARGVSQR